LRYVLNSWPVTSLSNSNRPPRSMQGLVLEQSCPLKQRGDVEAVFFLPWSPWGRPLVESLVVPVMVLGEMNQNDLNPQKFHVRGNYVLADLE